MLGLVHEDVDSTPTASSVEAMSLNRSDPVLLPIRSSLRRAWQSIGLIICPVCTYTYAVDIIDAEGLVWPASPYPSTPAPAVPCWPVRPVDHFGDTIRLGPGSAHNSGWACCVPATVEYVVPIEPNRKPSMPAHRAVHQPQRRWRRRGLCWSMGIVRQESLCQGSCTRASIRPLVPIPANCLWGPAREFSRCADGMRRGAFGCFASRLLSSRGGRGGKLRRGC